MFTFSKYFKALHLTSSTEKASSSHVSQESHEKEDLPRFALLGFPPKEETDPKVLFHELSRILMGWRMRMITVFKVLQVKFLLNAKIMHSAL